MYHVSDPNLAKKFLWFSYEDLYVSYDPHEKMCSYELPMKIYANPYVSYDVLMEISEGWLDIHNYVDFSPHWNFMYTVVDPVITFRKS